jgi:hypothetical protein
MHKQILFILIFLSLIVSVRAASAMANAAASQVDVELPITMEELYDHSELWPDRARLLPDADLKVGNGFPAVVLRVELNGQVLLDFGREGQYEVKINQTDLMERVSKLISGEVSKDFPNFIAYSFNAFVSYTGPKQAVPAVPPELLEQADYFVLLYVNAEFLENEEILAEFSKLNDLALQHNSQTLFVPTNINFYQGLAGSSLRNIYLINHFAFMAYIEAFGHHPGPGLTAVVIDPEGKLYSRFEAVNSDEYVGLLQRVGEALEHSAFR